MITKPFDQRHRCYHSAVGTVNNFETEPHHHALRAEALGKALHSRPVGCDHRRYYSNPHSAFGAGDGQLHRGNAARSVAPEPTAIPIPDRHGLCVVAAWRDHHRVGHPVSRPRIPAAIPCGIYLQDSCKVTSRTCSELPGVRWDFEPPRAERHPTTPVLLGRQNASVARMDAGGRMELERRPAAKPA